MNRIATKTARKVKRWKYDEKDVSDLVKHQLPDGVKVRWFEVQSGDSGDTYNVQLVYFPDTKKPAVNCNCWNGQIMFPLAIQGINSCKHVKNLIQFLQGE